MPHKCHTITQTHHLISESHRIISGVKAQGWNGYLYGMKKGIFLLLFLVVANLCGAQYLLYGTTLSGGTYNRGTIYYYNPFINKDSVVFSFSGSNGETPECDLLIASDSLLYGVTYLGGSHNLGVLFNFNPKTQIETVLLNLDSAIGLVGNGENDVIQGIDGLLYCCTHEGGKYDEGTIFSYDTHTTKDSVLFSFDSANFHSGANPIRGLYPDTSTGLLYGVTEYGGKYGKGTIHCFNPTTGKDSVLFSFDSLTGYRPESQLMRASDGLLYSMTATGGDSNSGVIYSYDITNGNYAVRYNFNKNAGVGPVGNGLMQAKNGLLYGMTTFGGSHYYGVVFSFDPTSNSEIVIANLDLPNGVEPENTFTQDPDNDLLYSPAYGGGSSFNGALFSLNTSTSTFANPFNFNSINGSFPVCGFTLVKRHLNRNKCNGINSQ